MWPSDGLTWSHVLMTWLPTCRFESLNAFSVHDLTLMSPSSPYFILMKFSLLRIYLFASLIVCYILCNLLPIFRSDIIRCSFLSVSQGELHVSKLFHHPSILPYRSVFIAENELWVITPFMAYGKKSNFLPYCCFSYVMQLNFC